MAKRRTVRGAADETGQRLEGLSVGVNERRNRLARQMTWTPDDLAEFNDALAAQRVSAPARSPVLEDL